MRYAPEMKDLFHSTKQENLVLLLRAFELHIQFHNLIINSVIKLVTKSPPQQS